MRKVFLVLLGIIVCLLSPVALAQNTHGSPNELVEMRQTLNDLLQPGMLPQQCVPAVPGSGLVIAAFTCKGYVISPTGLTYVNQTPGVAITMPNVAGTYWLALSWNTSDTVAGWTRISGSHYLLQLSATQPANPANSLIFAQVTVTSVVTAIDPINVGKSVSRAMNAIFIPEFASGGDGTAGNPWTGWDTAIDWTQSNKLYFAPCGTYNFANGITFTGGHVRFLGAGWACTIFQYTGTTGIAFNINSGSNTVSSNEFEFGHFMIVPTNTTAVKRAFNAVDIRESNIHDIWVNQWYGAGGSIAFRIFGRDTSVFERLIGDADRPFVISPNPHTGSSILNVGCDTCTFRNLVLGVLVTGIPTTHPCFEVEDPSSFSRINFEGIQSYNLCHDGFFWNSPNATQSSPGWVKIKNIGFEQNTDPTGYLVFINYGSGTGAGFHVQGVEIDHVFGGAAGQGIYLKGMQEGATIKNSWWVGWGLNPNNSGVGLKVDAQAGVGPSLYVSGGTVTGSAGQFCNVTTFNNCTNAGGSIYLTGTNTIAPNAVMVANNPATATCTKNPTTGVLTTAVINGVTPTASACSGTITIQGTTANNGSFKTLTIIDSYLDGDPTFNTGGLDPCDGSSGAPTGTHACILGLTKLQSWNTVPGGDIGKAAIYSATGAPQSSVTLMGQNLQFPSPGLSPLTTASASGSLANNGTVIPFATILDCPLGLSPCSGTFKAARMRVTVLSDDPACAANCIREAADVYLSPVGWSDIASQNGDVSCLSCSPHMVLQTGIAGQFIIFHPPLAPPGGFFAFTNIMGVTVRWAATVEVAY